MASALERTDVDVSWTMPVSVRMGGGLPLGPIKSVGKMANDQNPRLAMDRRKHVATSNQDRRTSRARAAASAAVIPARIQNARVPRMPNRPTAYSLRKRSAGLYSGLRTCRTISVIQYRIAPAIAPIERNLETRAISPMWIKTLHQIKSTRRTINPLNR